jgi:hypothetical protein
MGGIGLQELFIVVFIALAIQFQRKVVRIDGAWRGESWRPLLYTLYVSLTLITVRFPTKPSHLSPTNLHQIRIIYRLIEFSGGVYSTLPMHEVYFYVLEAVPMFFACLIMNIFHPGRYLVGPESEFPRKTRAEKKAEKAKKKQEKRENKEQKKQAKIDKKEAKRSRKDRDVEKGWFNIGSRDSQ